MCRRRLSFSLFRLLYVCNTRSYKWRFDTVFLIFNSIKNRLSLFSRKVFPSISFQCEHKLSERTSFYFAYMLASFIIRDMFIFVWQTFCLLHFVIERNPKIRTLGARAIWAAGGGGGRRGRCVESTWGKSSDPMTNQWKSHSKHSK